SAPGASTFHPTTTAPDAPDASVSAIVSGEPWRKERPAGSYVHPFSQSKPPRSSIGAETITSSSNAAPAHANTFLRGDADAASTAAWSEAKGASRVPSPPPGASAQANTAFVSSISAGAGSSGQGITDSV